jgi:hypothetical protein
MKLANPVIHRVLIITVIVAVPFIFANSAIAQNQNVTQNLTPSMVINMSDHSIKIGNTTTNETITFTNNTSGKSGNSTS